MPSHRCKEFKDLVLTAKKLGVLSFELDGFKFDLSGLDEKEKELKALKKDVKDLQERVRQLSLKIGFNPMPTSNIKVA